MCTLALWGRSTESSCLLLLKNDPAERTKTLKPWAATPEQLSCWFWLHGRVGGEFFFLIHRIVGAVGAPPVGLTSWSDAGKESIPPGVELFTKQTDSAKMSAVQPFCRNQRSGTSGRSCRRVTRYNVRVHHDGPLDVWWEKDQSFFADGLQGHMAFCCVTPTDTGRRSLWLTWPRHVDSPRIYCCTCDWELVSSPSKKWKQPIKVVHLWSGDLSIWMFRWILFFIHSYLYVINKRIWTWYLIQKEALQSSLEATLCLLFLT